MKIISEQAVTMAHVKKELEKIKKRDEELSFRSAKTEEYLKELQSFKKAGELAKKIEGLKIPRLKEEQIVKIVDILPKTAKDLKTILSNFTVTVSAENLKKIADLCAKETA